MNTEIMNQNEIKEKSDVLSKDFISLYSKGGDEEACRALVMSVQGAQIMLESFANVSVQIAKSQHEAIVRIYEKAILGEIQKEARELDSLDNIVDRYNEQVQILLSNLDTSNTQQVENVRKLIEQIQKELDKQLNATNKVPILDKIGRIFRR
ncbi:hypothetical protein DW020_10190 [Clostridium sp. AF37-5AT]|nr:MULTISPECIES: hypothetical protein [unclassified Clostridium]MBS7000520.1 hypothetical protein [Clostridiaceae bacterium]RHO94756.1 hypothetical protein DW020_10190 [Clostridium sp. AF37-5AT]RHR03533.1 hypothetical protein DWX64_10100 [Clostridium sp. AF20-17LB]HCY60647.1 hypothetical protein [Lachnoclostridium sp.]